MFENNEVENIPKYVVISLVLHIFVSVY